MIATYQSVTGMGSGQTFATTQSRAARLLEIDDSCMVIPCKSLRLADDSRVDLHNFILWQPYRVSESSNELPSLAQVEEMLVLNETKDVLGLLVTQCVVSESIAPYRAPAVRRLPGQHLFVKLNVSPIFQVYDWVTEANIHRMSFAP